MYSVLFVCLGNICRSPTAEGVFREKVNQTGLSDKIFIDSAGTSAYHAGEAPDPRSQEEALRHGYDLSAQKSRQVINQDFQKFDLIIAMDKSNLKNLMLLNSGSYSNKFKLFLADFAPELGITEVPDPYYGGDKGFTQVVELIETASDGLLQYILQELKS